jgi:hypothetical protein
VIDAYVDEIQRMRDEGAIVLIKWDGARTQPCQTVVVTRNDTDYVWRKDCDDIGSALREAIVAYKSAHPR